MVAVLCQLPRLSCRPVFLSLQLFVLASATMSTSKPADEENGEHQPSFQRKPWSSSFSYHFHAHPVGHTQLQGRGKMAQIVFWAVICSAIILKWKRGHGCWELGRNSSVNQYIAFVLWQSKIDNPFHSHSRYATIWLVSSRVNEYVYLTIRYPRLQRFFDSPFIIITFSPLSISLPGCPLAFSWGGSLVAGACAHLALSLLHTLVCLTRAFFSR